MAFSIKQIKAILSNHNMPVEDLDAAAEDICARHSADLDSIKEERDSLKTERDNLKKDAETLASVQKELDELKARPDDGYKEKYEKETQDFQNFREAVEREKALAAKQAAYQELCKDAGLSDKGISKAVKYADWDKIDLDEDGKVKEAKTHIKSIREEWAEHIVKDSTKGADTPTPPGSAGGTTYKTKDEIMAIKDDATRQKAIAENHEMFGF